MEYRSTVSLLLFSDFQKNFPFHSDKLNSSTKNNEGKKHVDDAIHQKALCTSTLRHLTVNQKEGIPHEELVFMLFPVGVSKVLS